MSANDVDLRNTMAMIQAETSDTLYYRYENMKALSDKGDSHGMPNRLRCLLHSSFHIIINPRHGRRQASWRALHSAFG
jgi:hypothetical protein